MDLTWNIIGEKDESNIKDSTIFDINLPITEKTFLLREELKGVVRRINKYLQIPNYPPEHTIVLGTKGSGKTASIRYVLDKILGSATDNVKAKRKTHYVSCKEAQSSYAIMKKVIGENKKIPKTEAQDLFKQHLLKAQDNIIVLDEFDMLKDDDILYFLTRDKSFGRVMLFLITNNPLAVNKVITDDVRSSMQPNYVVFKEYGVDEIFEILRLRAEAGLYKCDHAILKHIAAGCKRNHRADVRVAIKTLLELFEQGVPQEREVDTQVRKMMVEKEILLRNELLLNLEADKLKLLRILCAEPHSNFAHHRYVEEVCTVSKPQFQTYLRDLEKLGLIERKIDRVGRSTVYKVSVLLDEENIDLLKELTNQGR